MGCKLSKMINIRNSDRIPYIDKANEIDIQNNSLEDNEELDSPPILNNQQKTLIENTWKLLVENVSKVGVITFMSLFETHPDVQNVFLPFRGMGAEELKYSKELRAHALRVMGFVQKVVARIEEPQKCEQLLCDLGRKHISYGAKKEYVDLVGPQFIYAIKPSLGTQWSEDIENAWNQLFLYMGFHIKVGMTEAMASLRKRKSKVSLIDVSTSASEAEKSVTKSQTHISD